MRLAAIDIGTNTAQLLIVDVNGDDLRRIHAAERFVRLGEGVDASGEIGEAAQERLLAALRDHVDAAEAHGAERIVAGATSAMRDAANRESVRDRVRSVTGLEVDLLSGEDEATWSFAAACTPYANLDGPRMVVDVGGGSTELIVGGPDPSKVRGRTSLDVGCIRLTERCFDGQPPSSESAYAATAAIETALDTVDLPVPDDAALIGTAGTATALARVHEGPSSAHDALQESGTTIPAADVRQWRDRLLTLTVDEILELHPDAMAGRADVFAVGVMILDGVLRRYAFDALHVSPYELRYGLALRALHETTR